VTLNTCQHLSKNLVGFGRLFVSLRMRQPSNPLKTLQTRNLHEHLFINKIIGLVWQQKIVFLLDSIIKAFNNTLPNFCT
jgi:hypothetical protein